MTLSLLHNLTQVEKKDWWLLKKKKKKLANRKMLHATLYHTILHHATAKRFLYWWIYGTDKVCQKTAIRYLFQRRNVILEVA